MYLCTCVHRTTLYALYNHKSKLYPLHAVVVKVSQLRDLLSLAKLSINVIYWHSLMYAVLLPPVHTLTSSQITPTVIMTRNG